MTADGPVANVDLTDSDYLIKRTLFRNECRVYDGSGALVLKRKRQLFERGATVSFCDPNDRPVYSIEAESAVDFAGDYTLIESGTDAVIAVLETAPCSSKHVWRVRSPEGDIWAVIESQRTLLETARNVIGWLPREYTITGPGGEAFGRLEGRFSLWDTHRLRVDESGDAPRAYLVAAAIAVDILEGG